MEWINLQAQAQPLHIPLSECFTELSNIEYINIQIQNEE